MGSIPTGSLIRDARVRAGMSREQLGDAIGSSKVTVWRIETGATTAPKISTLSAIASALGVSADNLLGIAEPKPRASKRRAAGGARGRPVIDLRQFNAEAFRSAVMAGDGESAAREIGAIGLTGAGGFIFGADPGELLTDETQSLVDQVVDEARRAGRWPPKPRASKRRASGQHGYIDWELSAGIGGFLAFVALAAGLVGFLQSSADRASRESGKSAFSACVSVCEPSPVAEFQPALDGSASVCRCRVPTAELPTR